MRKVDVFFYGLFMDRALLRARGLRPVRAQPGSIRGFRLRIGRRATLVAARTGTVHGMVMALTHDEIGTLYSGAGLTAYRAEAVEVRVRGGTRRAALCFNLPEPPRPGDRDVAYASRLRALARRLKFPARYADAIR